IVSLKEGSEAITVEAAKTQEALNAAEAELAEGKAVVKQMGDNKSQRWKANSSQSGKGPESQKAHVAGIEAKVETLKTKLRDIQQKVKQLSELRPQMEDLERKRGMAGRVGDDVANCAHSLDTVLQWSERPCGLASERFTGKTRSAGDETAPL